MFLTPEQLRPPICLPASSGECIDCGLKYGTDIYAVYTAKMISTGNGQVHTSVGKTILCKICGDCRYIRRYHKWPARESTVGANDPEPQMNGEVAYTGWGASHTLNRFRHVKCRSLTHARVLMEIERNERHSQG